MNVHTCALMFFILFCFVFLNKLSFLFFLSHSLYLNLKKFAQNVSRATYTANADARVTIQIRVWLVVVVGVVATNVGVHTAPLGD